MPAGQGREQGRKPWIDTLRGACMVGILLDHTELYYAGCNIVPYELYVGTALCVFFFLSGYLLFKPLPLGRDYFDHRLRAILRTLVVPYFLFTLLLCLPKSLVHGVSLADGLLAVAAGRASWFVAALIVAELLFLGLLRVGRGRALAVAVGGVLSAVACAACVAGFPEESAGLPWQLPNALMAVPLLGAGWVYHRFETAVDGFLRPWRVAVLLLLFVALKVCVLRMGAQLCVFPIIMSHPALFLADVAVAMPLLAAVAKRLPRLRLLGWVGSHSLAYYFFCGAAPLLVSRLLQRCGVPFAGGYGRVLLAFVLVCVVATVAVCAVYAWFPFAVGRRREGARG